MMSFDNLSFIINRSKGIQSIKKSIKTYRIFKRIKVIE